MFRLIVGIILSCSSFAMAEEASRIRALLPAQVGTPDQPAGVWLFAGGNGAIINSDILDNLNNGDMFGMRLISSLYQPTMIYNVGFDLDAIKLEGASRSNSVALDLAARYRLTNRWSMGPELITYLHSGKDISGKAEELTPFVGVGAARDIPFTSTLMRVGARAMVDMSIEGQTATVGQVYVEVGSNFAQETKVSENIEPYFPSETETPAVTTASEPAATVQSGDMEVMKFNFDISSAKLEKANTAKIAKLAKILKANKGLYGKLEIIGHADRTGTDKINNPLSKSRAITVAEVMKSYGVNNQVMARGSHAPISETDLAANRRVEIVLTGVKNKQAVSDLVKLVR